MPLSSLLAVVGAPSARSTEVSSLRGALCDALVDEVLQLVAVPHSRRPRLIAAVGAAVDAAVPAGATGVDVATIEHVRVIARRAAGSIVAAPRTPPRDVAARVADSRSAVAEDRSRLAVTQRQISRIAAARQMGVASEVPSLSQLRIELHEAARRGVAVADAATTRAACDARSAATLKSAQGAASRARTAADRETHRVVSEAAWAAHIAEMQSRANSRLAAGDVGQASNDRRIALMRANGEAKGASSAADAALLELKAAELEENVFLLERFLRQHGVAEESVAPPAAAPPKKTPFYTRARPPAVLPPPLPPPGAPHAPRRSAPGTSQQAPPPQVAAASPPLPSRFSPVEAEQSEFDDFRGLPPLGGGDVAHHPTLVELDRERAAADTAALVAATRVRSRALGEAARAKKASAGAPPPPPFALFEFAADTVSQRPRVPPPAMRPCAQPQRPPQPPPPPPRPPTAPSARTVATQMMTFAAVQRATEIRASLLARRVTPENRPVDAPFAFDDLVAAAVPSHGERLATLREAGCARRDAQGSSFEAAADAAAAVDCAPAGASSSLLTLLHTQWKDHVPARGGAGHESWDMAAVLDEKVAAQLTAAPPLSRRHALEGRWRDLDQHAECCGGAAPMHAGSRAALFAQNCDGDAPVHAGSRAASFAASPQVRRVADESPLSFARGSAPSSPAANEGHFAVASTPAPASPPPPLVRAPAERGAVKSILKKTAELALPPQPPPLPPPTAAPVPSLALLPASRAASHTGDGFAYPRVITAVPRSIVDDPTAASRPKPTPRDKPQAVSAILASSAIERSLAANAAAAAAAAVSARLGQRRPSPRPSSRPPGLPIPPTPLLAAPAPTLSVITATNARAAFSAKVALRKGGESARRVERGAPSQPEWSAVPTTATGSLYALLRANSAVKVGRVARSGFVKKTPNDVTRSGVIMVPTEAPPSLTSLAPPPLKFTKFDETIADRGGRAEAEAARARGKTAIVSAPIIVAKQARTEKAVDAGNTDVGVVAAAQVAVVMPPPAALSSVSRRPSVAPAVDSFQTGASALHGSRRQSIAAPSSGTILAPTGDAVDSAITTTTTISV